MSGRQAGTSESTSARRIVEREQELEAIDRCLTLAEQQAGQLLLIEGPAGIGKTRLLAEARALVDGRGFRVLAARGGELERGFGFGVVRQLFEPALAEADVEERRTILAGAARLAGPLFGSRAEAPVGPVADLSFRRLHGLYWLCANLTAEEPVLITVDDGHWSDDSSLLFLDYLARRLDGLRVLVLVAHRPGEADAEVELLRRLSGEPGTTVLRPAALSDRAVAVLAEDVFGRAPDEGFAATCWSATGGNPFLVWELMWAIARGAGHPTADAADRVAALGPETVARSVAARLRRLPSSAGRLCAALAVLGGEAELRHVAALAASAQDAALVDVDALVAAGILEPNGTVRFVHPIVRAAVYADLPAAERERSHAAAAQLLTADGRSSEEVAAHLMRLHPRREDWIVDTLLAAGLDGVARAAPEAAIPFLRRALDEPPSAAARPNVLLALGSAELSVGHPDAAEHLSAAVAGTTDLRTLTGATVALMYALIIAGRVPEALNALRETIDVVAPRERELALTLEAVLGASIKFSDERELLSARWRRYGLIAGDTPGERLLLTEAAWERAFGGAAADEVVELAERSIAEGAEAIILEHGAPAQFFEAAWLLAFCDRFTRAEAALRDALAAGVAVGSLWTISAAENWLGHLMFRRGRIANAEAHGKAAVETAALVGWRDVLAGNCGQFAQALAERGAFAEAEDELERAQIPLEITRGGFALTFALEGRAAVRLAQGRAQEALVDLYTVRDLEAGKRADNPASCAWRSQAALALHALGEDDEARRLADEEVTLARSFGAPRAIGIALRVSGLMTRGSDGFARLHEAVEVLEPSGARLEHARALTDLGAAIRRAGRRVDAREPLRRGLGLAQACGAIALAARAHEELLASGARPRRLSFSGVDSLTASERRVAEMAARGLGNLEIAQALFVSRKTIETHLGHVYTKLGIASRDKLAPLLAEAASETQ